MIDKFGRTIDYLRISLTDRCNLRCIYCMPQEGVPLLCQEDILTFDEILRVCRCGASLGIRKIKLTGGEPLIREGCADLAGKLKGLPGIEKVTITTNGILLADHIKDLVDAGIDGINISLDTLDDGIFRQITRRDGIERVLMGLKAALSYPQLTVKVNSVPVVREESNLVSLVSLARKYPVHVRFIEMMPIGYGKQFPFQDENSIIQVLEKAYGPLKPVREKYGNGPCHYYEIDGFQGKIGFISAVTHKFCSQCNRVRLTSEGFLKGCLQFQEGADLRKILREGGTDHELTEAIRNVIYNKPAGHHFYEANTDLDEVRGMSQIGG